MINDSGIFADVLPGSYTVRVENNDCEATSTADTIEDSEQTPTTPTISATDAACDASGYVTVTNFDNTLSYILVDGDDNDTEYAINDSGVFANVVPGTYTVRVENNDCNASSETATVSPNAGTPEAPTISATDADCENANGAIEVTNFDAALSYILVDSDDNDTEYVINDSGIFADVLPGSYTVRVENNDCEATSTADTIEDSEQTPTTPTISATDADCDSANGAIEVTNFDATLSYILVDSDDNDTEYVINNSGVFADVLPGSYTVRVKNNDCEATSTADTIEDSEQTPATPTISATNADCDSANGAIEVTNFDATLSYILVDSDDNDTEYVINDSGVFADVVPGTYTVRVENNDCEAASIADIIEDSEQTPATPTISATDADCDSANGAIEVTNFDAVLSYILVDGDDNDTEYVINDGGVFADVLPGSYTVRVENNDCEATSTADTIEDSEQTPATPTISATDAACDASGYVTVTNFDNTLNYTLVNSKNADTEYVVNDEGVFVNVVPGTYTVRVENNDCNASSETATVSPNAGTPDAPTISATDADCDNANGAIEVTNFDATLSYILVDIDDNDTEFVINDSGVFTDVLPGSYTVRVENNDCEATSTADTIGEQPLPAIADNDSVVVDEDNSTTIVVLLNDTNQGQGEISIDSFTQTSNGVITQNEDDTFEYTPAENFNGEETFTYTITNGNCGTSTATVTITVNPVNDAPVANDDTASTDEDNVVVVDVLDNDTDVDGDELTVVSTTQPSNGSVVINEDGTITYTPNENFNGEDTFEYTIEDEDGLQDTATVTITVNPVNDAPVANDDTASTDEDNVVTVDVLDNDTDVDGDELTVVSTTEPSNGSVVINEDGTVTYTPNENFNGEDTFEYTIEDEDGLQDTATVTITVNPVNDAPVANDDTASTDEDNAVTVDVLDNDTDVDDDELTVVSTTQPSNGNIVINEDGTITYTPNENFNGEDTFEYTIEDEDGLQDMATVTITVNPVNDAPVANDDTASTDEDNVVTVDVLDNDTDVDGDELTVVSTTEPSNGSVVINEDGTVTYTPNENFNGTDSFEYTIEDKDGLQDTATVTITVNPVNDAPVANDDIASTDEDNALTVDVLDNDTDVDGDELTVVSTTEPSNGSVVINEDGTVTYTPNENFNGSRFF